MEPLLSLYPEGGEPLRFVCTSVRVHTSLNRADTPCRSLPRNPGEHSAVLGPQPEEAHSFASFQADQLLLWSWPSSREGGSGSSGQAAPTLLLPGRHTELSTLLSDSSLGCTLGIEAPLPLTLT